MPVFIFEAPTPTGEVYQFGIMAKTPQEAKGIVRRLARAIYIGVQPGSSLLDMGPSSAMH